jgi:1-deoxy-D-xylulose-5-phosphate reductoisomerase
MKKIAILGSTGSIGTSTLKVVRHLKKDFQVVAIAAHSQIDILQQQALEFHPEIIGVFQKEKAFELQKRLPNFKVVGGMEGMQEVASYHSVEFVVSAIVGMAGLIPTLSAIKSGKTIGLANKEVLVAAGQLVMDLVRKHEVSLIPIDSEHSALFQCLHGEEPASISRLILTASGGPFREFNHAQLSRITPEDALKHPIWKMGGKITIDCSTLMNKGLEAIEAHWLFNVPIQKIEVVIHPQSIIHSFAEFIDGSMLAQMNEPDMILPVQYAMTYPKRLKGMFAPFNFLAHPTLEFKAPDYEKFPCLRLAFEACRQGGSLSCYMNAANEVLVNRFLNKEISWQEIGRRLEKLMEKHQLETGLTLDNITMIDAIARKEANVA